MSKSRWINFYRPNCYVALDLMANSAKKLILQVPLPLSPDVAELSKSKKSFMKLQQ